jgi:negative regulator of flagellin synthesis FlgM
MTVERIGPPDPISNLKKAEKAARPKAKEDLDSINVSQEAKSKAEVHMALESARLAPDVRVDKVQEAKRKLQDPSYPTQEVIESVADGILKTFGIS